MEIILSKKLTEKAILETIKGKNNNRRMQFEVEKLNKSS